MTEFDTWRAFANFEREVSRNRRYIRTEKAERFLNAIRRSSQSRRTHVSVDRGLWRAQAGHSWRYEDQVGEEIPSAYPAQRMLPLEDRAMEGRANARGIPVVYLCTNKEAAMSEVRPGLGSYISLGLFKTTRDLALVDCARDHSSGERIYFNEPPDDKRDTAVWSQIARAFTKPVTRSDDTDDYVATQILAELFRDEGYDGIAYRSAFGDRSTNIALFDRNSVKLHNCQLFEATQAKFNFQERDNPYWARVAKSSKKKR